MNEQDFIDQLIKHEGLRLKPYLDTESKTTIGIGRNLDDNGITEEEAMYLLKNDIQRHAWELEIAFPAVQLVNWTRYYVLLNMAFNLGIPRLRSFKKMWAAIERQDFEAAALEMLDSKWHQQVGARAEELSELMKRGEP